MIQKIIVMILFVILVAILIIFVIYYNQTESAWILYVISIQYGGYIVWYSLWGLVCCLMMKSNRNSISKSPDWRVEMVFQDLLLMN